LMVGAACLIRWQALRTDLANLDLAPWPELGRKV
jgi:hypothetical protein